MSTTEIGKELRKLRVDKDERLYDMSKRLGLSSAFLSALERGSKSPPIGFEEKVAMAYRLVGEHVDALRRAANRSRKTFSIDADTALQRDVCGLMARRMKSKMDALSPEELEKILSVLRKESDT